MKKLDYIRLLIGCFIVMCTMKTKAESLLDKQQSLMVVSNTLTNVFVTLDTLWKDNPQEWVSYVGKLRNFDTSIGITLSKEEFQVLFTHICRLPVRFDGETGTLRLNNRQSMIGHFSSDKELKHFPWIWLGMAEMIGGVRSQLSSDWDFLWDRVNGTKMYKEPSPLVANQDPHERFFQLTLRFICKYDWRERRIKDVRAFAQTLPPDERKQFLDKIKELARSDEEEAKLLDTPIGK